MEIIFNNSFEGFLDGLYKLYKNNFKGSLVENEHEEINHENSYKIKNSILKTCGSPAYEEFKKVFFSKANNKNTILIKYFKQMMIEGNKVRTSNNEAATAFRQLLKETLKKEETVVQEIFKKNKLNPTDINVDSSNKINISENIVERLEKLKLNKKVIIQDRSKKIKLVYNKKGL